MRPGLSFSHIGIYVHDLAVMEAFYTAMLDFTVTDRGDLPRGDGTRTPLVFLSRDPREHHQIVLAGGRPEILGFNPINQISLKADSLETLVNCHACFLARYPEPVDPVCHGNAISFYVPDPEGNRIEVYWDTPWYVSQPMKQFIDLNLPPTALLQAAERQARALPGFKPHDVWSGEMARRMGVEPDLPG
jgi:catechol-2,3-dioxygenase